MQSCQRKFDLLYGVCFSSKLREAVKKVPPLVVRPLRPHPNPPPSNLVVIRTFFSKLSGRNTRGRFFSLRLSLPFIDEFYIVSDSNVFYTFQYLKQYQIKHRKLLTYFLIFLNWTYELFVMTISSIKREICFIKQCYYCANTGNFFYL